MDTTLNTKNFFRSDERSSWLMLLKEIDALEEANKEGSLSPVMARQLFVMLDFLSRFYVGSLSHTSVFKRLRLFLKGPCKLSDEQSNLLIQCRNTVLHGGGNLVGTTGKSGYARLQITEAGDYLVKKNKSTILLSLPELKAVIKISAISFEEEITSNERIAERFNKVYRLMGRV